MDTPHQKVNIAGPSAYIIISVHKRFLSFSHHFVEPKILKIDFTSQSEKVKKAYPYDITRKIGMSSIAIALGLSEIAANPFRGEMILVNM